MTNEYTITTKHDGCVRVVSGSNITVLFPGQDVSKYSQDVQDACATAWTPEVIDTWVRDNSVSEELTERDVLSLVQAKLDSEAQSRGYDNIISACSYAGYENRFQAEALQLGKWRSAVWDFCYEYVSSVKTGEKPMPKRSEVAGLLPKVADYA